MSKAPDLREIPDLPEEIIQAGLDGDLILFVGAGVSMLLGLPSWAGLASKAFGALQQKGLLNFSELEYLKNLDPKKQLSIAKLIAEEHKFDLNLREYFSTKDENKNIYQSINDIGCTCVTTNYDTYLDPKFHVNKDDYSKSVKPESGKRITNKNEFHAKYLDAPGNVIHLHGSISEQETMIVTTKQYLEHYDNENVKHILRELFTKKTVLFIGYGLEEVEILEHILRRGTASPTSDRRRFALQGYFRSQEPLYRNLHHYYEKSFGVHLIGFIRDHKNYAQQESIFKDWVSRIQIRKPTLVVDIDRINEVLGND